MKRFLLIAVLFGMSLAYPFNATALEDFWLDWDTDPVTSLPITIQSETYNDVYRSKVYLVFFNTDGIMVKGNKYSDNNSWYATGDTVYCIHGLYDPDNNEYYCMHGNGSQIPINDNWWYGTQPWKTLDCSRDIYEYDYTFYFSANITTGQEVTPLSFPLTGYTAYTAPVSSVMDHSMTTPYTKDGIVLAFNGEEGDVDEGCYCYTTSSYCDSNNYTSCTVAGFMKDGGGDFLNGIINYDDSFLYYDGHPGYDYLTGSGTDINAPADGTLCVATSVTQQPNPTDVWRDTTHCPYSTAGSTNWSGYHTFYIIHEELYINGSTNDYMTVFLHSDDLESSVRDDIESYGYAEVSKNQHIAESGDFGSSGAYHMHLEVYKKVGENWERVDPYGDGTNNILWEQE